jgi:hypothetical protein
MLIKAYGAIVLTHVNFELARSPPALPTIISIAKTEIAFADSKGQASLGDELHVEESEQ